MKHTRYAKTGSFKMSSSNRGSFKRETVNRGTMKTSGIDKPVIHKARTDAKRVTVKKGDGFRTVVRGGKRFALVPIEMVDRLGLGAGPALPKPDASGNVPAAAWSAATIVRGLLDDMNAAGLSQAELSRLSGVRPETLNRIIKGHVTPETATLAKLDEAIQRHGARLPGVNLLAGFSRPKR